MVRIGEAADSGPRGEGHSIEGGAASVGTTSDDRGRPHGRRFRGCGVRAKGGGQVLGRYRFRLRTPLSLRISRTQWWPGIPVTPPPAWVALDAWYSPEIGVR